MSGEYFLFALHTGQNLIIGKFSKCEQNVAQKLQEYK